MIPEFVTDRNVVSYSVLIFLFFFEQRTILCYVNKVR